jgi:alkane 1-monooxygenase
MQESEEAWYPHLLGFILPVVTIAGIYQGGWWCFAGFVYALGLCPIIDFLSPQRAPKRSNPSPTPWNALLFMHGIFMYSSIGILLWRANLDGLGIPLVLGALSTGVVGGVSGIVNAHEAGHRRKGSLVWRIARVNLFLVLYSHFTTEHNHGHHRHYATEKDPASSPRGRGLWTQILMTIPLQYISSWKTHSGKGRNIFSNPIFHGIILQMSLLVGIWWYSTAMLIAFLIQAVLAIILLEYVNYLQHYGLHREIDGRQTEMHSWEHRGVWSRWTLLELPLHPAHHLKASAPMWELRAYKASPQLPCGYYACLWLAIFPPLWKRIMGKRLDLLQAESA